MQPGSTVLRFTGLVIAAVLLAAPAPRPALFSAPGSDTACDAALAAFDHVASMQSKDRPWVLAPLDSGRAEFQVRSFAEDSDGVEDGWYDWMDAVPDAQGARGRTGSPGPGLTVRLTHWRPLDINACPGIAAHAAGSGVTVLKADPVRAPPEDDAPYPFTTAHISQPLLSDDGRQAVFYADQISGPLGGGGYLVVLVLGSDDRWRPISLMPLWVS